MPTPANAFTTRRRTRPARSLNFTLGCLLDAARGQVRGLGRAGAAGGFSVPGAGAVRLHGASLFFLPVAGIANRYETQSVFRRCS